MSMLAYLACGEGPRTSSDDDDGHGGAGAGGGPSLQVCDEYIACVAATRPGMVGEAIAVYGSDGSCWQELQEVECLTACEIGLSESASAYPDVKACNPEGDLIPPVPVSFYILIDKSGSMADQDKWANTEEAFVAFFQNANSPELEVALRFWPDEGCEDLDADDMGNNDPTCDSAPCATPQVPLGPLSDSAHQQALTDLFATKNPGGATPMSASLEGGVVWAQTQEMNEPDRAAVVILVTDGEPNGCLEDPAAIEQIVATAFQNDGITTYAVGLEGSGASLMESIAAAGGTESAFFIGAANGTDELLAALLQIAGAAATRP